MLRMLLLSISTTVHIQRCLQRLADNDDAARAELLAFAKRRLKVLADSMFSRFSQLRYREQADDVLQEAMVRLWRSLETVRPNTVAEFMGLAALQMRRALRDLARTHFGRSDAEQPRATIRLLPHEVFEAMLNGAAESSEEELLLWTEFHAAVDRLPEPHRTAFDLLYYHELTQMEAAEVMNVSIRQMQRYWQSAGIKLRRMISRAFSDSESDSAR